MKLECTNFLNDEIGSLSGGKVISQRDHEMDSQTGT